MLFFSWTHPELDLPLFSSSKKKKTQTLPIQPVVSEQARNRPQKIITGCPAFSTRDALKASSPFFLKGVFNEGGRGRQVCA